MIVGDDFVKCRLQFKGVVAVDDVNEAYENQNFEARDIKKNNAEIFRIENQKEYIGPGIVFKIEATPPEAISIQEKEIKGEVISVDSLNKDWIQGQG